MHNKENIENGDLANGEVNSSFKFEVEQDYEFDAPQWCDLLLDTEQTAKGIQIIGADVWFQQTHWLHELPENRIDQNISTKHNNSRNIILNGLTSSTSAKSIIREKSTPPFTQIADAGQSNEKRAPQTIDNIQHSLTPPSDLITQDYHRSIRNHEQTHLLSPTPANAKPNRIPPKRIPVPQQHISNSYDPSNLLDSCNEDLQIEDLDEAFLGVTNLLPISTSISSDNNNKPFEEFLAISTKELKLESHAAQSRKPGLVKGAQRVNNLEIISNIPANDIKVDDVTAISKSLPRRDRSTVKRIHSTSIAHCLAPDKKTTTVKQKNHKGTTTTKKGEEEQQSFEDEIAAMLAEHNKKFQPKPTYVPRKFAVKEVKLWEEETGKLWSTSTPEEREQANQWIEHYLKNNNNNSQIK